MADVKISALPAATTPLAGTEVLPIVQSSTTKKVTISDVTAGRSVSAASLTLTTSPLAVGSGGTGLTSLTSGYIPFGGSSTYSSDSNLFWDNTNKRLGIGTTSPAYPLDVSGGSVRFGGTVLCYNVTAASSGPSLGANDTSGTNGATFNLYQNGVAKFAFGISGGATPYFFSYNNASTYESLKITQAGVVTIGDASYTAFNTAGSERLRITSAGNVGIGTTTPAYKLDVSNSGGSTATARLYGNDQANVRLRLENAGSGGNIWELVGGSPGANNSSFAIYDATGAATRLLIDTSGNLGLGVTPSASGLSKAFDLVGGAELFGYSNGCYLSANAYHNGTNWIYKATTYATVYTSNSGQHVWYNSATGTAGNPITLLQAMTLDASGNLLVGAASNIYPTANRTCINAAGAAQALFGLQVGGAGTAYLLQDGTNLWINNVTNGSLLFYNNGAERARIDSSGNLLVGDTANQYSARAVIKGGFGATIASTYTLSNTAVKIAAGVGLICIIRDTVNGGTALVLYENTATPIIVQQTNAGKYITTGTPTGTQILLANVSSGNAGVQASTASGAGISVSVANISCQNS